MNKSIKAGIFTIIILIILFGGWVWLADIEFKKSGYEVIISFPDVTGLKVKDPVRVGGVEKGFVKKLQYKRDYIEVRVLVEPDVVLYSDANAAILDVAMISGTKYVKLNPGVSDIPLSSGTLIEGRPSIGIPVSILGDIGEKLDGLLFAINSSDLINSVGSTLKNLQSTAAELSEMMKESKDDIKKTAMNAKKISGRLENTLVSVDSILAGVKSGKGTLGKLATDDTLYQEFNATLSSIRELVQDIKENPRRYFKLF